MKSKEELNALKEEIETVSKKLAELTEEELTQVAGGDRIVNSKFDPPMPEFPEPPKPRKPEPPKPEPPMHEFKPFMP